MLENRKRNGRGSRSLDCTINDPGNCRRRRAAEKARPQKGDHVRHDRLQGSVLEKFRAVKGAGFDGVEPMSHMNQDEVVEAFEATGLKAASVCCSTHWDKPLSDPDEAVRKIGLEGLIHTLHDAKRYGASSVLLVPGKVTKDVTYDQCWTRSIAEIRKAIPAAEETGVKIAIENVWNNFITKPEQAKQYLDEIDSPWVGWHFDIGNVIKYSPPETWIPVIGKKILKLHIKEYAAKSGKGFGVRLFDGDNDWPAIMAASTPSATPAGAFRNNPATNRKTSIACKTSPRGWIGRLEVNH